MDRKKLFKVILEIPEDGKEVGRLLSDPKEAKAEMKRKESKRMWLSNTKALPAEVTQDPINGIRAYINALNDAPIISRRKKGGYEKSFFSEFLSKINASAYFAKRRLF